MKQTVFWSKITVKKPKVPLLGNVMPKKVWEFIVGPTAFDWVMIVV